MPLFFFLKKLLIFLKKAVAIKRLNATTEVVEDESSGQTETHLLTSHSLCLLSRS